MRHFIGLKEERLRTRNIQEPVFYDPSELTTAHTLICGGSGSGKSFQSIQLLSSASAAGIQVDIFDVHDELEHILGAKAVKYSQATGYGFNPLVLDADPHTGGVNRQTDFLIGLIDEVSRLGIQQKTALRNLIVQTYASVGIDKDKAFTWRKKEITEAKRTEILNSGRLVDGRYPELGQYFPTLNDLMDFARRKIIALTAGTNNPAVLAYEQLSKALKKRSKANTAWGQSLDETQMLKLDQTIEKLTTQCEELWSAHIRSLKTGEEPEDIIRFESASMLSSLLSRIELLANSGTFRANAPPFGDANCRVHQIKSLTTEQQILFVKIRLREIFEHHKRLGPSQTGLRHVLFLDEAHKFFHGDQNTDVVSILAKESRKFGIGLWCASQSPLEFPEHFLTNVGATMLLGIHSRYWKQAASMLRTSEQTLIEVRPTEVLSIKMQYKGESDPPFINVVVPNSKTDFGRRAANAARRTAA